MKTIFLSCLLLMFATVANTKIVFYSKRDGNSEIYTMNDNGSHLRRIWINNKEILLSVDATGLITKERGNYDIYRYNFISSILTQLTTHPAEDLLPRWIVGTLDVSANRKTGTQWGKLKVGEKQSH